MDGKGISEVAIMGALALGSGDVEPIKNPSHSTDNNMVAVSQPVMGDVEDSLGNIGSGYEIAQKGGFENGFLENLEQELSPEEKKEIIEEQGGIVLDASTALPFSINPSDLGASDQYGIYDPIALGEGKYIKIGETYVRLTYENSISKETGFVRFPQGEEREVGQVFNELIPLPDNAYGRVIHLSNYTETLPGDNGVDVRLQKNENQEVVVFKVLLSGTETSILPPEVEKDEDGNVRITTRKADRIPIKRGGYLQKDGAYLGLGFANFIDHGNGDLELQILGYLRNPTTRTDGIYIYNMS